MNTTVKTAPITLTERAVAEVKNILKEKNVPAEYGLRIGVWRLLDMIAAFNVKAGCLTNGYAPGDPNGTINTVPQFGSPSQVLGPRNVRFNAAFRF